jgi:putative nucleotidyltransferase with HDIG domain
MKSTAGRIEHADPLEARIALLDERDPWCARHREAVARYSLAIAAGAGFPFPQQELVRRAALLHDVGKLGLPERILAGGGTLTALEWELVRGHPLRGAAVVARLGGGNALAAIVAAHHEHVDGRGYPAGLQGGEIPALARIVAVAEAYDAMTAEDSYQRPVGSLEARRRLSKAAGTQFEPRFVEILVGALAGGGLR